MLVLFLKHFLVSCGQIYSLVSKEQRNHPIADEQRAPAAFVYHYFPFVWLSYVFCIIDECLIID